MVSLEKFHVIQVKIFALKPNINVPINQKYALFLHTDPKSKEKEHCINSTDKL